MNSRKCLLILLLTLAVPNASALSKLAIGDIPPNYLGEDSEGLDVNLTDHKGKIVIISFWASWCAPCLKELPMLEDIQARLGKEKINVIAVNFKESRKQYRHIKRKLSALALTLTHDKRGLLGSKFGVEGIPHLFIVGRKGTLIYQSVGYGDSSRKKIVTILNQELSS
ncbi:TlpA family protein disulfide reductase [Colwellia hornerae]|uniref:TlpA family protein disulfide reductase n=1 Tax=Colwellia hornerae TaxID=89402 RepID=UPI001478ADC1|nr:TlpA disulfide reductase family protein [Colwellia hornerae]